MKFPSMILKNPRVRAAPGQLYIFDFKQPDKPATVVPCTGFPAYGTAEFGPHGLHVFDNKGTFF